MGKIAVIVYTHRAHEAIAMPQVDLMSSILVKYFRRYPSDSILVYAGLGFESYPGKPEVIYRDDWLELRSD
jgi:hypothetical protein